MAHDRETVPASLKGMLVDSHAHLDFQQFDGDREALLQRAYQQSVGAVVSIGTQAKGWQGILRIVETLGAQSQKKGVQDVPYLFATMGVHPCDVKGINTDTLGAALAEHVQHPQVVGLGETGLDFFHTPFDEAQQQRCLFVHAEVGLKHDLPLVIHSRNAEEATVKALKPWMQKGLRAVIHCFSGTAEFAKACLDMGCFISFSGIVTFKKTDTLQDVARTMPMDRLLVETDAPYLAPMPHRGKRNESAFVAHTAEKIADLRGIALEELTQQTTRNFCTLFSKVCATCA